MSNVSRTTVSLNDLRRMIPVMGATQTIVIPSEPGVGKSTLLKLLAEDMGHDEWDYIYLDCAVLDMGDLMMNVPDKDTGTLTQYVSGMFKLGNGKKKCIMADEIGKLPKILMPIVTRLFLERTLGDTPLPEGSIIFCTTNNTSDGVGDVMQAHVLNRVTVMPMRKPTGIEWVRDFANRAGITAVTQAFAVMNGSAFASYLDDGQTNNPMIFNPRTNNASFLSPRSLAKADLAFVKNRKVLGEDVTFAGLVGTIGKAGAEALSAFIALEKDAVDPRTVLADPTGAPLPEKLAAMYMVMFNGIEAIQTQDDLSAFVTYIGRKQDSELESVFYTFVTNNAKTTRLARGNAKIKTWMIDNHMLLV